MEYIFENKKEAQASQPTLRRQGKKVARVAAVTPHSHV